MVSAACNFIKKLLKLKRNVVLVDSENRIGYFTTLEYPVAGNLMFFQRDNKDFHILVDSFSRNENIYYLNTEKGLYILRYL